MKISKVKASIKYPRYHYDRKKLTVSFNLLLPVDSSQKVTDPGFCKIDEEVESIIEKQDYKIIKGVYKYSAKCTIIFRNEDLKDTEVKNPIYFVATVNNERIKYRLKCRIIHGKLNGVWNDRIFSIDNTDNACYFLISPKTLVMTVREKNVTDSRKEKMKLFWAFFFSKLYIFNRPVLLFEKKASRYEESASCVYEKLIDEGYKNAYFILDRNCPYRNEIDEKYIKNIVDKYSFRHYLYFFSAKTFIASEMPAHALELRPISKFVRLHLLKGRFNNVFLQHGVMYMVSLDAGQRCMFAPEERKAKSATVVSSRLELEHFRDLGGYREKDLYLTGLPKFDRNILHSDADKIAIMPTWRPWEERICKTDITNSSYYKVIERIVSSIDEQYKDRIWIMPHPLIKDQIRKQNSPLKKYLSPNKKYDVLLRDVKVLITDYSSISYDAFYRGSNIIFYWEEKDECISHYGKNAKLMLTENLAFGDICYSGEQLRDILESNLHSAQKTEYIQHYHQLVEFHDGKNTERLVNRLKKENLL